MTLSDLTPQGLAAKALAALAVAALGFSAGWAVNGWRLGEHVAQVERDVAEDAAKRVGIALAKLKDRTAERDALAATLAADDKLHTANLRKLTDENDSLRVAVAAGARVVRVRGAVCPGGPNVPQAPAGSGVDSGTGAVLTPAAGQDFLDLRGAAARVGEKLAACQDAVRRMTGQ